MASSDDDSSSSYSTPSSATPYSRTPYSSTPYSSTPYSSTPYKPTSSSSTPYKPIPSSSTTYPSPSYSSTPSSSSSSSSSSSDSSSNSTPSKSGDDNSGESNNNSGDNSNNSSGGNSNNDNGNNNSGGDNSKDKDDGGNDNSGSSRQNNNNDFEQNDNNNSGQNNNNQSNNSNQNNNGNQNNNNNNNSGQNNNNQSNNSNQNNNGNQNNNNNNNGRNSNSQSSQGNNSPPKSSSNYWRAPPPPLESTKSPPTTTLSDNDSKAPPSRSTSTPVIIGLAAGAGVLLFVMILLFLACSKRKKKRQSSHLMDNPDGSDYWQSGPYKPNEHVLNMPPPPSASPGWTNPGQYQPPMVSSEMNSSNFSGPHGPPLPPPHPSMALGFNTSTFSYDDLAVATSGFSQAKLLGQGGFGFVHKGVLPNGKEIAVKSLKSGSGQGDREFAAEVEIISRVHHRHLVSLVGYCLNGDRKLLVYEFVPNNNLEFHLYNKNRPPLDWASRIKIALGSAKGLAYLHEDCHPKIIHRDIKAANILIDYNYEAKVADFGLAKLNQENVTHVSTRVMGTFGYLAPEYASSGKLTEKSDVFSFGIMLLELITGRRPVDTTGEYEEDTLVDWARPLCLKAIEVGNYSELADPRLENKYDQEEMARMVACASTSVRHSAKKRPKMSQIVRALEGDVSLEDLHEGIKPSPSALFGGSATSSDFDSDSYNANMKNFRKQSTLGGSQDYPSSEEMVRKA